MTIWQRMNELNLSRYQLSKSCGLLWDAVSDICCGRRSLLQCDDETLKKLASALELPVEELLKLETGPQETPSPLETGLPGFLQSSIDNCLRGAAEGDSCMDCLYDDLYGSINSAQWGGDITVEQADYLRKKYLLIGTSEEHE